MEARRIFQTTLVHPIRPEFSVAALFLGAEFPAGTGVEAVSRTLGIEPLSSGEISEDDLRPVLACILTGSLEVFDMNPRAFRVFVNESGIDEDFLDHTLAAARLVVERGQGGGQAGLAAHPARCWRGCGSHDRGSAGRSWPGPGHGVHGATRRSGVYGPPH